MSKRVVYQRKDCKWAWRLVASNGDIIAVDGSQGYENEADARAVVDAIIRGDYKDAEKRRAASENCSK